LARKLLLFYHLPSYNHRTMRWLKLAIFVLLVLVWISFGAKEPSGDPRLKNSYRRPAQEGWTYVHLEGSPSEIGFQHGWLLSSEIWDGFLAQKLEIEHDAERKWDFYRETAQSMLWPHVPEEYREELQGITAGLVARGGKLDLWDVAA